MPASCPSSPTGCWSGSLAMRRSRICMAWSSRKLVAECCYEVLDECWGEPLGAVRFTPRIRHELRSVSKSVLGLLYGIALDEGKVPVDGVLPSLAPP